LNYHIQNGLISRATRYQAIQNSHTILDQEK